MTLFLGLFECGLRVIACQFNQQLQPRRGHPGGLIFFLFGFQFFRLEWMDDSHGMRTFGAQNKCQIWRSVSGRSEIWLIFASFFFDSFLLQKRSTLVQVSVRSEIERKSFPCLRDRFFFFENLVGFQPRAICSRPLDTP